MIILSVCSSSGAPPGPSHCLVPVKALGLLNGKEY